MLPKKIYTTPGIAGSGKDFVVDKLIDNIFVGSKDIPTTIDIIKKDKFAGAIKEMLLKLVNIDYYKKQIIETQGLTYQSDAGVTENFLADQEIAEDAFEYIKNANIPLKGIVKGRDITIRQLLQNIGTEVIRKIDKHFHVKMLARRMIDSKSSVIMIPDARFNNELRFVERYNELDTEDERRSFLIDIATYPENTSRSMIRENAQTLIKPGEELAEVYENFLVDHLDAILNNKAYVVDDEHQKGENEHLKQELDMRLRDFDGSMERGVVYIHRKSDRELPDHPSEKINADYAKLLNGLSEEKASKYCLENEITPIEDNPQFLEFTIDVLGNILEDLVERNLGKYVLDEYRAKLYNPYVLTRWIEDAISTGEINEGDPMMGMINEIKLLSDRMIYLIRSLTRSIEKAEKAGKTPSQKITKKSPKNTI